MKKENCLAYSQMKEHDSNLYGYAPAYDGEGIEELVYSYYLFGSYYVYEHGAKEKDYIDYCDKLKSCGFELYSSNSSNGNSFATYFDGENIVNVSYISYRDVDKYIVRDVSYVLISVDSVRNSLLPCKAEKFEAVTDVKVSLVGFTGLVIRMLDGRFIVIDSGMDKENIFNALTEQNVLGGKPVVAAWLFSHAHGDHFNGFYYTLEDHADEIEIQTIVHNFPGESLYMPNKNYMEGVPNIEGEWMGRRNIKMDNYIKEKMPSCRYTIAHAGQIFEYAGVKIEVLQTSENLYKKQMFDSNMSSVVYMLTMPDGKLLALGDAVDQASKIIRKIHGKALKCDAVVLAHHGYNGGDEEMYFDADARVAIWPLPVEEIVNKSLAGNFTNHFDYHSVKYNFIRSKDDPAMVLYHGMSAEEIERFVPKFEVRHYDDVCYESRKNPKHYITEAQAAEGYGDAPRYYGRGEETETFVINPEDKTYEITVSGVTRYEYDYYWNSFKRDGYVRMEESADGDNRYVTFADLLNEVHLSFVDGVITAKVGPAGKNVLDLDTMTVKGGKREISE
ncbi:MAG: hypothetical protein IJV72_05065 [Clostridia bacterium]|nr:hypothetical protein [Clostridia bacterium]